ncbi:MAG: pyridoxine 5'-phosphate synthase [Pseudomonadota bacterium]|jgi:pyridoxine 5-phosphate synthase|nr:pyridoxine 5'-phosphate synthase [Pseudomonadota bacterium]
MEKTSMEYLRLGVNIDHVATVRNARGGIHPSPVAAALLAQKAGADGITAHLREDRRHIRDDDITALKEAIDIPLNFEMAATEEMVAIALKLLPNAACIVPERREELTTEGGLAVAGQQARLSPLIQQLKGAGIRVSLFVDADEAELNAAAELGADIVELHTGRYCDSPAGSPRNQELERIAKGAQIAASAGLEVHAGHGLSFETVQEIAALPEIVELNIGHFLIGAAIYTGLEDVILQMRQLMNQARAAV